MPAQRCRVMQEVIVGPGNMDVILRGGFLIRPLVMTACAVVDSKKFVRLWKGSAELSAFLTPSSVSKRPLVNCSVFKALGDARRHARGVRLALLSDAHRPETAASQGQELSETLDFDEPADGSSPLPEKMTRKHIRRMTTQLLACVQVSLEREGQDPWTPWILIDAKTNVAPAMEATQENFRILHEMILEEMSHDQCSSTEILSSTESMSTGDATVSSQRVKNLPRCGPDGAREYYHAKKGWVRRARVGCKASTGHPYGRHHAEQRLGNCQQRSLKKRLRPLRSNPSDPFSSGRS